MTIGLLVTAAVAILTQATGAYIALIQSLGVIGAWAPFVVEIVIAIYLGARIEKIKPSHRTRHVLRVCRDHGLHAKHHFHGV